MNICLNGMGIISRRAMSPAELEEAVSGRQMEAKPLPLAFPCGIEASKLRRNSRYNRLACAAADQALKEAGITDTTAWDSHRVGTVLTTGYGSVEYSTTFSDSVVRGDPGLCSPSLFAGSVPNSCVGQICIVFGLKGFSTMLAGGDPLEYAALLLRAGRADAVLTGAVEEYVPALYDAFGTLEAADGCDLSEGAAMAVLSRERTENTRCRIVGFAGANLGSCPWLRRSDHFAEAEKQIGEILRRFPEPEVFLSSANGTWFDGLEAEAFRKVFPDVSVFAPKTLFGETLGCGFMMNILAGAALLRGGQAARVLVSGIDMIGNYSCALLER